MARFNCITVIPALLFVRGVAPCLFLAVGVPTVVSGTSDGFCGEHSVLSVYVRVGTLRIPSLTRPPVRRSTVVPHIHGLIAILCDSQHEAVCC